MHFSCFIQSLNCFGIVQNKEFQHITTIITYTREEQHIPRLWILTFGGQPNLITSGQSAIWKKIITHLSMFVLMVCCESSWHTSSNAQPFGQSAWVRSPKRRRGKESNLGLQLFHSRSTWAAEGGLWWLLHFCLQSIICFNHKSTHRTVFPDRAMILPSHCQNILKFAPINPYY